jgi:2Fe-2S ferredoxin
MPTLIFVLADHTEIPVRARAGNNLMRVAVDADIPGIPGECGGALACATCHVWIDRRWADGLPVPEEDELEMLQDAEGELRAGSRLSCQVIVDDTMEGMRIEVPGLGLA